MQKAKTYLCSSSVHGTPFFLSCSGVLTEEDLFPLPLKPSYPGVFTQSKVKGEIGVVYPGTGTKPASILQTSTSNSWYCLITSSTVFPGIISATRCHRSGVSLSYTARAFSNSLFSAEVHLVLLLLSSTHQLELGEKGAGERISISHFIASIHKHRLLLHRIKFEPIDQ